MRQMVNISFIALIIKYGNGNAKAKPAPAPVWAYIV